MASHSVRDMKIYSKYSLAVWILLTLMNVSGLYWHPYSEPGWPLYTVVALSFGISTVFLRQAFRPQDDNVIQSQR